MSNQRRERRQTQPLQTGGRPARDVTVPPFAQHAALPAPGTATALATGAAGRTDVKDRSDGDPPDHGAPPAKGDSHGGGHEEVPKDLKKPEMFWVIAVVAALLVLLGVLFAVGVLPRLKQNKELAAGTRETEEAPVVNVQHPRRAQAVTDLVLPANVMAWQDTGIYARVTGYVKAWNFNIGDSVKAGDVMALIDAPDIDQQLEQSKAQLAQNQAALIKAEADLAYNELQLKRFQDLRKINAVTQQQVDQQDDATRSARSTVDVTKANIAQYEANVRLYTQQQLWEQVTAPFSGKVTARSVNVGDLIMPGTTATNTSTGGGHEMFHMAQTDPLRVMISIPQTFVSSVAVGQPAEVYFRDDARHAVRGTVTHFAGALDPTSRTLLTEVDVPNPAGYFAAGMYLEVKFSVQRNKPPLMVPESALIFNADGTRVGVIRNDGDKTVVHFQEITVGRDTGAELEVQAGLVPDDLIVINPGERLSDGGPVKLGTTATPPAPKGPAELSTAGVQQPAIPPAPAPTTAPAMPATTGPVAGSARP
jgi:RND family efflux transporter MFP subunit